VKNTPSNPRRLSRRFTGVLLACLAFVATVAVTARPAEAASSVRACFQVRTGGAYYNNVYTQPGLTAWLFYSTDNQNYYLVPTVSVLDQNGCVEWNVAGTGWENYYLRILVYSYNAQGVVGATYFGWSSFVARPGYGSAHLGFDYVTCDICPVG
jgi:hypothetical protein